MRNIWLDRKPRLYQQTNPYIDHYGKWFVMKESPSGRVYLHKNGSWHSTTYDMYTGEYLGYYDSFEEAEAALNSL